MFYVDRPHTTAIIVIPKSTNPPIDSKRRPIPGSPLNTRSNSIYGLTNSISQCHGISPSGLGSSTPSTPLDSSEIKVYTKAVTKEHLVRRCQDPHHAPFDGPCQKVRPAARPDRRPVLPRRDARHPARWRRHLWRAYNTEEMTYALKTADAKFLMTMRVDRHCGWGGQERGNIKGGVFLLEGEMEGFTAMKQLLEIGKSYAEVGQIEQFHLPARKKNKDVCGFLSFSSGTTGLPKAVSRMPT
jgi:hypothetical protein